MTVEGTKTIAGVIVTYNTDPEVLVRAGGEIRGALTDLIVVDNSDSPGAAAAVRTASESSGFSYLPMNGNHGIADAQNRAVELVLARGVDYLLFLDDDSGMTAEAVRDLTAAFEAERARRPATIAAGPLIVDSRTGESLAFAWRGDAIKRVPLAMVGAEPVEAAFLLGSGCLVDTEAFTAVGPFRGDYFIDHVDKEWGLRAGTLGFRLVVVPSVRMEHLLADSVEVSARGIQRHQHGNPLRDYYLTRNSLLLVRDLPLSGRRKLRLLVFTLSALARKLVNESSNPSRRAYMLRAVFDAVRGQRGRLNNG